MSSSLFLSILFLSFLGHRVGLTRSDRFDPRAFCDLWSTASRFLLRHIVLVSPLEYWGFGVSSGPSEELKHSAAASENPCQTVLEYTALLLFKENFGIVSRELHNTKTNL